VLLLLLLPWSSLVIPLLRHRHVLHGTELDTGRPAGMAISVTPWYVSQTVLSVFSGGGVVGRKSRLVRAGSF